MAQKTKKNIRTKINVNWDLSVLYKSPEDPQIEKDLIIAEKAYDAFAKSIEIYRLFKK